jgi:hypothetical protein
LGTPGGDCGTARRVVQGALKLILEPIFKLLFKRGRMDIDRNGQRIANLFRSPSSTYELSDLRDHPPVPTETGAVPSDDGFGRDDEKCLFPA